MIGGTVIETITVGNKVWINCREDYTRDECAIFVENDSKARTVSEGDSVWWHGKWALWTPKSSGKRIGKRSGIKLNRIGFSGISRPK